MPPSSHRQSGLLNIARPKAHASKRKMSKALSAISKQSTILKRAVDEFVSFRICKGTLVLDRIPFIKCAVDMNSLNITLNALALV